MIRVVCLRNPFDPLASREIRDFEHGKSIRELVDAFYPEGSGEYTVEIAVNGVRLDDPGKYGVITQDGDSVVFCAVPGGPFNPLAIIAMLAVTLGLPALRGLTDRFGYAGVLGASLLFGPMGFGAVAGGMVINAITAPATQDPAGSIQNSQTYSWDPSGNPTAEGIALPEIYGTCRIIPPIIGKYIETLGDKQYLNILYAIAGHAVDSISSIRINQTDIAYYSGVSTETRLGDVKQSVIQNFADTRTDVAVGAKLNETNWTLRTTGGTAVQGIGVGIGMPKGLYYANDSGGMDSQTVKVYIEYSLHGVNSWTRLKTYNKVPVTVVTPRWSAGRWISQFVGDNDPDVVTWIEIEAGSTNQSDHTEGDAYGPLEWFTDYYGEGGTYQRAVNIWHWWTEATVEAYDTVSVDHVEITASQTTPIHRMFYQDNLSSGQYDIRCKLVEALPATSRYGNDTYFEFYQEIVYDDFTMPGTSLLSLRALATDQLSGSMPTVDCLVSRNTVPVWTGAEYANLSASNPSWICYHLLHKGGDGVPYGRIDYTSFLSWANWCDDPAGDSSQLPFTCHIYFDQASSLRNSLDIVALNGRGSVVQLGSKFTCIADRPETLPVQRFMFNVGNIEADSFNEEWLPMNDRANAVEVSYFDSTLDYSRQILTVYATDFDTSDREINTRQVTLYGCTGRDLAGRYGMFLLNCNRYLTLTCSFNADIDAIACIPGDVIEVAHDVPQWGYSGRVVSSGNSTITLDRPVTIVSGVYHVRVKHADDTFEEKVVTNGAGTYTTLTISGTWTDNPALHDLYSFGLNTKVVKLFRVLRISRDQDLRRKLTCLEYVPEVYTDGATIPPPEAISDLVLIANLAALEVFRGGSGTSVLLSWTGMASSWNVYYSRIDTSNWIFMGNTTAHTFEIANLDYGVKYYFAVTPTASPYDGEIINLITGGPTTLPAIATPSFIDDQCLYIAKIYLVWNIISDINLGFFEIRTDLDWGVGVSPGGPLVDDSGGVVADDVGVEIYPTGAFVYRGLSTHITVHPVNPSMTFYLRAADKYGQWSAGYDSITLTHTVPVPVFVSITGLFAAVRIEWEPINDESYDVVEIWRSTTNDRSTAGSSPVGSIHSNVYVDTNLGIETTYYYWLRAKSVFNPPTYSDWDTGPTNGHEVTTQAINLGDLSQAVLDSMLVANDIIPPKIVTSLPSLPNDAYPVGTIVYLTTDEKLYVNKNGAWSKEVDGADVIAGSIIAGKIAAGAIGATEIAAETIAVKHLVVTDYSNICTNGDFTSFDDIGRPSHWSMNSYANVIDYAGAPPTGKCLELDGNNAAAYHTAVFPVSTGDSYYLCGYGLYYNTTSPLYIYLRVADKDGAASWPYVSTVEGNGVWARFSGTVTITTPDARTAQIVVSQGTGSPAPHWLAAQIVCRRAANAELIVDGSITADKLTANHLDAVNTESGTFQQTYTAPGDNNTTPGAGLKITGGKIEAYGLAHSFGGTILSSDGNYMVAIGKYLTGTGLTKRYPLNNSANFTADGQVHFYSWVTSAWVELCNIGIKTVGSDYYGFYLSLTGERQHGIYVAVGKATGIGGTSSDSLGYGVTGGATAGGTGGYFYASGGAGGVPLRIGPSGTASAPSHAAGVGSLWVTSAGVLYINTDGGTTWAKVGAQ